MLEDFVPTRGSRTKTKTFQSLTYNSFKPNKQKEAISKKRTQLLKPHLFNIKKAKQEVILFGMSSFDSQKKEEAKVQLAIKLGAKPTKSKYVNYRFLKEKHTKQEKEEKLKAKFQQLGKNSEGQSTARSKGFGCKHKKSKGGLLNVYGTVKTAKKN